MDIETISYLFICVAFAIRKTIHKVFYQLLFEWSKSVPEQFYRSTSQTLQCLQTQSIQESNFENTTKSSSNKQMSNINSTNNAPTVCNVDKKEYSSAPTTPRKRSQTLTDQCSDQSYSNSNKKIPSFDNINNLSSNLSSLNFSQVEQNEISLASAFYENSSPRYV